MGGFHSDQRPSDGIHAAISYEYADAAARTGATGFDANDLLKFAHQQDNDSVWMLTSTTPTWIEVTKVVTGAQTTISLECRKSTAGTINKGELVYLVSHDDPNDVILVELARADSDATMPCIGIAAGSITDTLTGLALVIGKLTSLDTSTFTDGDLLYVSASVAGDFTNVKPLGPNSIQQIGQVADAEVSGKLNVNISARVASLPNLADANLWIGDSNGVPQERTITGDVTVDNTGVATIAAGSIANAQLADMAANTVKANATASPAAPQDVAIPINTVLGRNAGNIVAGQVQTGQIADNAVDNTKAADMAGFTVKAKPDTSTGDPTDLSVGTNTVLGRVAGDIVAAQAVTAQIADDAVTNPKLSDMAAWTLKLRNAGTSGDPQDVKISALTEETVPVEGDWIAGEESGGELRKYDVRNLPLPDGYVSGARITYATAATVTIGTTGQKSAARDSTDVENIRWTGTLTANLAASGAGGLDTGSEAADTWYAVHVIGGGGNPAAALLSTSATAPTLPGTYTIFRRVGWIRNDAASNLYEFVQWGGGADRQYHWRESAATVQVLTAGTATTFTDVSLAGFVPPTSTRAYLNVRHQASGTDDHVKIRPDGSAEADPPMRVYSSGGDGDGDASSAFWQECSTAQLIEYENLTTTDPTDIWVLGFEDGI